MAKELRQNVDYGSIWLRLPYKMLMEIDNQPETDSEFVELAVSRELYRRGSLVTLWSQEEK